VLDVKKKLAVFLLVGVMVMSFAVPVMATEAIYSGTNTSNS